VINFSLSAQCCENVKFNSRTLKNNIKGNRYEQRLNRQRQAVQRLLRTLNIYTVSQKEVTLYFWYLCQMSSDFCIFSGRHTHARENLKQTHLHSPPHLVIHVPTIPCENYQRIRMHTANAAASRSSCHWTGISQRLQKPVQTFDIPTLLAYSPSTINAALVTQLAVQWPM